MRFPLRDFTNQYISSSYQDVLQQYLPSDILYILDGYGNVVFTLPSASFGQMLITSDVTSSINVLSSSYSLKSTTSENSDFAVLAGEVITARTASYALKSIISENSDFASLSGESISSTSSSYSLISNNWKPNITTLVNNAVLNSNYSTILVSCTTSSIYVSLPSASLNKHQLFNIKKIDNTIYSVIIQTVDSSSIDDTNSKTISTQYTNLTIQSNGNQYYIL